MIIYHCVQCEQYKSTRIIAMSRQHILVFSKLKLSLIELIELI